MAYSHLGCGAAEDLVDESRDEADPDRPVRATRLLRCDGGHAMSTSIEDAPPFAITSIWCRRAEGSRETWLQGPPSEL